LFRRENRGFDFLPALAAMSRVALIIPLGIGHLPGPLAVGFVAIALVSAMYGIFSHSGQA